MMRSRFTSLLLVVPLIATGVALLDAAPAAAEDTGVCTPGDTAVAAKLQNYRGASTKFRDVSEGAVRAALPRLGQLPTS
jgi:hypothetical protein